MKHSPLLKSDVIQKRLKGLKDGFASNAIEGNPLTEEEKEFLIGLVKRGLSEDEITEQILQKLL